VEDIKDLIDNIIVNPIKKEDEIDFNLVNKNKKY
jgi:hypothetical protein